MEMNEECVEIGKIFKSAAEASRYLIKHSDRFLLSEKGGDLIVNSNCRDESCI